MVATESLLDSSRSFERSIKLQKYARRDFCIQASDFVADESNKTLLGRCQYLICKGAVSCNAVRLVTEFAVF